MDFDTLRPLVKPSDTKMVLLVIDGVGGIPAAYGSPTALEAARIPNLHRLAARSTCGLQEPVGPGITPGSGPGHLALFGYDPLQYQVGRGVLSALGIGFDLQPFDVAARGNFCTLDEEGRVTDRRAGRIATEACRALCEDLREIELPSTEFHLQPIRDYRFLLVLRRKDLSPDVADTDPQATGTEPLAPQARTPGAEQTVEVLETFLERAGEILKDRHPANGVLLRGFSKLPDWPTVSDAFGLTAAAVADYPMYRGVSRLVGMAPLDGEAGLAAGISAVRERWEDFDYFYVHVKGTDSAGEDGDFDRKVALLEEVDAQIPDLLDLKPDVLVVTGDHSTPSPMRYHSWHPVPVMLWSHRCRPDRVNRFGEWFCESGALGPRFPARDLMALMLAHADRLEKFGA